MPNTYAEWQLYAPATKRLSDFGGSMMIAEGTLDERKTVAQYLPELADSGFGDATVRQVLDMTTSLDYNEDADDAAEKMRNFSLASGTYPRPIGYNGPTNTFDLLKTVKKVGPHGARFDYQSLDTEVLGFIIGRITGKRPEKVLEERIWSQLGAENDANIVLDEVGSSRSAGGLSATARDFARFGEMMRRNGKFNGKQIVPAKVVARIRAGGSKRDFANAIWDYNTRRGWSYKSQWWHTHNAGKAFMGIGMFGQAIYVDPKAEMVIVRFMSGPDGSTVGFDPITQAESGFMSLNGFPDGEPVRTGSPIVDLATGMSACNVILMALLAREKLGRGQRVEVALIDTAVAMTGFYGMAYLISGHNPGRFGNSPNGSPTVGVYHASDGPFYMACANDRLYRKLVTEVLDRPDLVTDPDFSHRRARTANKEKLRAVIASVFATDTLEKWMAKMKKANIPVGYLRTVEEGFNAPEIRGRDRLSRIPHPTADWVPNIETPLNMSLTPTVDPVAAPLLGQHTREVLHKTLGYDDRHIGELAEAGAFGRPTETRGADE